MSSIASIESSAATEILTSIARLESELAQVKSVCAAAGLTIPAKAKKAAEKKAKAAAKPDGEKKPPNVWIRFTQQVDGALKAAEISVGAATIAKQFASSLKDIKPYAEWTDEDIVTAWSGWEKPEQSKMSSKKSSAASSEAEDGAEPAAPKAKAERKPRAKMTEEQKAAAKLKRDAKKADSAAPSAAASAAASAAEESSAEEPPAAGKKERKPRAKMTDEQKAAAKLKRDAKKAAGATQPLPASSPSSDGEEAPKAEAPKAEAPKPEAAKPKPVLKKKTAPASFTLEQLADFDTFTHDGTDYGRNIRGDVSTQDGAYAGHWDGKAIVKGAPPADWEAIMRIGQE
jgi:hypothetical protein